MSGHNFNKNLNRLLDICSNSVLDAMGKESAAKVALWPIPTPQGILFWGKAWAEKLNLILHAIEEQQKNKEDLITTVKFPSRIVHILWRTDAIKISNLSKKEKFYTINKLFDYLALFRKKKIFCENAKNIIWNEKQLRVNEKGLNFFSTEDKKTIKLLFRFQASLFLYTELIYWANHPLGHSFHGPYLEKERPMLIREYFDLKPDVWLFSKELNFSEIEIFEIYKKGTGIKLEFFERGIRTAKSFRQNLLSFALKVNGKPIKKAEQLINLTSNLQNIIEEGSQFIQSLNLQQLIEKHAEYWFYALKPLCNLVVENWQPPQFVYDNIYKNFNEINDAWENKVKKQFGKIKDLPIKQQKRILREYFDPRV